MVRVRHAPTRQSGAGSDAPRPDPDRGAVAVEFALLFPLLFFLLFGAVVFGWRIWEHQAGQSTAREAARLAALGIADPDGYRHTVVCLGERNGLRAGTLTRLQIAFSDAALRPTGQAAYGGYVEVTLTYRSALGAVPMVTDGVGAFPSTGLNRVEQLGAVVTDQDVTVPGDRC